MGLVSSVYAAGRGKKKKKVRHAVTVSAMHDFVKAATGRSVQNGESPLVLAACVITSRLGCPAPGRSNKSLRKLIDANEQMIREELKDRRITAPLRPEDPADSHEFLSSFAWRKLRMQAIKKYGARCQCCGATPADGIVINVDHIKPRKLFPQLALDLNNLQVLCSPCNHGKGNWDATDWRETAA